MMTKKDYVAVARMIREMRDYPTINAHEDFMVELIQRMQDFFSADNPKFDRDKFQQASNGEK